MADPAFARDVEGLVRRCAPGWTASTGERGDAPEGAGATRVEIGHRLSDGFAISANAPGPLTLERVERWLGEGAVAWHVELLAIAPEPKNPEPVRSVVRYAEMFAWTNLEVQAMAGVLVEAGAVSEEEYDRLRSTVGGGAPDLPRPDPGLLVAPGYRYRTGG